MSDDFEPRRAEPGQVFGYTADVTHTVTKEAAAKDDFEPKGELVSVDEEGRKTFVEYGKQVEIRADDEGVVRPKTLGDVAVLDSFGLPVARSAVEPKTAKAGKE
jgi:membrane-associated protease RseP (regulator of RpoE activity)